MEHPFFGYLSSRVATLGLNWYRLASDNETSVAQWRRPLFEGYDLELSLMAEPPSLLKPGYFGFSPTLFVVSDRQTSVWNGYRLWDCFNLIRGSSVQPQEGAIPILVTGLRWLMRVWHEPKGTPWPVPGWSRVQTQNAKAASDELGRILELHLPKFLSLIETGALLARTMLNLETFPGKDDGNGPRSACRSIFTAILLHDLGRTDEALKELDLEERQVSAKVHGGLSSEYLEAARCQTAKLTQWMREERASPI